MCDHINVVVFGFALVTEVLRESTVLTIVYSYSFLFLPKWITHSRAQYIQYEIRQTEDRDSMYVNSQLIFDS